MSISGMLASTGRKRERMAECSPPNTPRTECDPDLCSDEYGTDDDAADDDDVRNSGGGGDGQGETAASLSTNPIEVLMHSLPFPRHPFFCPLPPSFRVSCINLPIARRRIAVPTNRRTAESTTTRQQD